MARAAAAFAATAPNGAPTLGRLARPDAEAERVHGDRQAETRRVIAAHRKSQGVSLTQPIQVQQ